MTVIEVLFAMFVVLFGLIGIATLLPMAGRQASDSYSMTHGLSSMQNTAAAAGVASLVQPAFDRNWWTANDVNQAFNRFGPFVAHDPGASPINYDGTRAYWNFDSKNDALTYIQQRRYEEMFGVATAYPTPGDVNVETARRDGLATGFCIDPLFCADQFQEGWHQLGTYQHLRNTGGTTNNEQGVFRRSRMPFFDERTGIGSATGGGWEFQAQAVTNTHGLPKLIRLSFAPRSNIVDQTAAAVNRPVNLQRNEAERLVMSLGGGDLRQFVSQDDQSSGPLREFLATGDQLISSNISSRISWIITLTPTEEASPGIIPRYYDMALVVFNNRDRNFEAAPIPIITGQAAKAEDRFALGEKMCFATAPDSTVTSPIPATCGELPYSPNGGTFEIKLWSDNYTDPTIRAGDWVMLSRKIELGNNFAVGNPPPSPPTSPADRSLYKVIHRHRWYRIITVDEKADWKQGRVVRLAGEPWDYPEIYWQDASGLSQIGPTSGTPVYSKDLLSRVDNLDYIVTTATIFPDVVGVYKTIVELQ